MSMFLPTGNFKWLSQNEIDELNILAVASDSETGYILEVDLKYPTYLNDLYNDLPFCCENIKPPTSKQTKLICNLNDKKNYIIHYRNLQQALLSGQEQKLVIISRKTSIN